MGVRKMTVQAPPLLSRGTSNEESISFGLGLQHGFQLPIHFLFVIRLDSFERLETRVGTFSIADAEPLFLKAAPQQDGGNFIVGIARQHSAEAVRGGREVALFV